MAGELPAHGHVPLSAAGVSAIQRMVGPRMLLALQPLLALAEYGAVTEEFHENRPQRRWHDVMGLSIETLHVAVGQCFGQRLRPVANESRAVAAVDDERRHLNGRKLEQWQLEIADDRRVVDQRMGHSLESRPERRVSHLDNDLFWNPDQPGLEQLDGFASAPRRDELREPAGEVLGRPRNIVA